MMYDDVAFTAEQLKEYYNRNEHYAVSSLGGTGSLSADNLSRYDRIIDDLQPEPDGTILDVGCGQGGFVAQCLKRGFSAAGIEPSKKSRDACLKTGLDVFSSIEEYASNCPHVRIGTIVLSHVLEHLLVPQDMLKALSRLAPGAAIYVEVPDGESYISPDKVRWHELYFEHLNHFCKESLLNLAVCSGIEVERAGSAAFSRDQADVRCLSAIGRLGDRQGRTLKKDCIAAVPEFTLPQLPVLDLPKDNRPLALWGVSQYAMLLIGTLPQLKRITRLFDASPAKIGRKIRGVAVEDTKHLGTLSGETRLVLPFSQHSQQMLRELEGSAIFSGEIVYIRSSGDAMSFIGRR
jgi:SAM-dependent methyltransferase